jgi:hypothetical protein
MIAWMHGCMNEQSAQHRAQYKTKDRRKITNYKHQITNKSQAPMTKISNSRKILFEIWDLEFIPQKARDKFCKLEFVIWHLLFFAAVSRPWYTVQGFKKCMLFGLIEVRECPIIMKK